MNRHVRSGAGGTYLGDFVEVPVTILVDVFEHPSVLPGHLPLGRIDVDAGAEIEREIDAGEFDGYRMVGLRWMGDGEEAE